MAKRIVPEKNNAKQTTIFLGENMVKKPVVLCILDGYGINENHEHNAIYEAKTPVMDMLMKEYPWVKGDRLDEWPFLLDWILQLG